MKTIRAAVVVVGLLIAAWPQTAPAASSLAQLHGMAELKSWFNGYRGHPRLILLLSPT